MSNGKYLPKFRQIVAPSFSGLKGLKRGDPESEGTTILQQSVTAEQSTERNIPRYLFLKQHALRPCSLHVRMSLVHKITKNVLSLVFRTQKGVPTEN
jgi:hypothetical protein